MRFGITIRNHAERHTEQHKTPRALTMFLTYRPVRPLSADDFTCMFSKVGDCSANCLPIHSPVVLLTFPLISFSPFERALLTAPLANGGGDREGEISPFPHATVGAMALAYERDVTGPRGSTGIRQERGRKNHRQGSTSHKKYIQDNKGSGGCQSR